MNKIEEILLKFYPDIKDCELDDPICTCTSELNDLLLEFGKQCFEAGRCKEYDKVDGDYYDKFRDFDEYLKSL